MGKHFEELIFFIIIGWFIWVVMGSNGSVRIERGCTPVQWGGDAITSVARAAGTDYGEKAKVATDTVDYHCQMALWDFFYRDSWEKQHPKKLAPAIQQNGIEAQPSQFSSETQSASPLSQTQPITTPSPSTK